MISGVHLVGAPSPRIPRFDTVWFGTVAITGSLGSVLTGCGPLAALDSFAFSGFAVCQHAIEQHLWCLASSGLSHTTHCFHADALDSSAGSVLTGSSAGLSGIGELSDGPNS